MMQLPADYAAWCKAQGITAHNLEFSASPDAGFVGRATKTIAKGELLLVVPLSACLQTLPDDPYYKCMAGVGLPALYAGALRLAAALKSAQLGAHGELLRCLPPVGNVPCWTAMEEAVLRGTAIEDAVTSLPARQRWPEVQRAGRAAGLLPPAGSADLGVTEAEFVRAAELIMSRSFHSDSGDAGGAAAPQFVPVADLLNHDVSGQPATSLMRLPDDFRYYALRDIAEGEEVTGFYGALTDAQLCHTYGFTGQPRQLQPDAAVTAGGGMPCPSLSHAVHALTTNPFNAVTITKADVVAACSAAAGVDRLRPPAAARWHACVELLGATQLLPEVGYTLHACSRAGSDSTDSNPEGPLVASLPPQLLTVVQVLTLSSDDQALYMRECGYKARNGSKGKAAAAAAAAEPADVLYPLQLPLARVGVSTSSNDGSNDGNHDDSDEEGGEKAGETAGGDSEDEDEKDSDGDDDADDDDSDDEDDDSDDEDDIQVRIQHWQQVRTVLLHALKRYPSTLADDYAWWAAVSGSSDRSSGSSSDGASAAEDASGSTEPAAKRLRTNVGGESAASSNSSSSSDAADPWSWPLEQQVATARASSSYRACRIVAMGEKELLARAIAGIDADLQAAEAHAAAERAALAAALSWS